VYSAFESTLNSSLVSYRIFNVFFYARVLELLMRLTLNYELHSTSIMCLLLNLLVGLCELLYVVT